MVLIDGSHSYSYVRSDKEATLRMFTSTGTVLWHDYPAYPVVYSYLNEIGSVSNRPIVHIKVTGLAIYSKQDLITDCPINLSNE